MTTVERSHDVNHGPLRSSSSPVQQTTPSEADLVEAKIKSEEEEILEEDEEITSVEDNEGDGSNDIEDHMINIAIAKSVEDTRKLSGEDCLGGTGESRDGGSPRYSLRKRQHPGEDLQKARQEPCRSHSRLGREVKARMGGQDIKAEAGGDQTDAVCAPTQSQHARLESHGPPEVDITPDARTKTKGKAQAMLEDNRPHHSPTNGAGISSARIKVEPEVNESASRGLPSGPFNTAAGVPTQQRPAAVVKKPQVRPSGVPSPQLSANPPQPLVTRSAFSPGVKVEAPAQVGRPNAGSSTAIKVEPALVEKGNQKVAILPPAIIHGRIALGAVPNPLLQTKVSPIPSAPPGIAPAKTTAVSANGSKTVVPCPLTAAVPCPLPSPSSAANSAPARTVSAMAPPPPQTNPEPPAPQQSRDRAFSVDLDPSVFDFTIMGMDSAEPGQQGDPDAVGSGRSERGYSFDFFNLASDDILTSNLESSVATAFGSGLAPASAPGDDDFSPRPRGDSIIFDPISFQDGGIHETNALSKRSPTSEAGADSPADEPQPSSNPSSATSLTRPSAASVPAPAPATIYTAVSAQSVAPQAAPVAIAPASQVHHMTASMAASAASSDGMSALPLELLNKDGRIGIYLPEERKARIARFHAKRKNRIWRKRIKYDCRKKLADSRPRIKGRFVKRSDTDE